MNKRAYQSTSKSTNNSTNNNNNQLKEEIINLLKNSQNPLSTSDLSSKLNKAWHTIDRACLMLHIDNKVVGFKVGKMNLWRIK